MGRPALSLATGDPFEIPVFDLSQSTIDERQGKARELVTQLTQRPFDLARGQLLRLVVVRLDDQDQLLVLTMHHIVSDGWSIGIFLRELVSLYNAFVSGNKASLPELPLQYVDFAAWQRAGLGEGSNNGSLKNQLEFWRERLA
jgi:hypothetical protein